MKISHIQQWIIILTAILVLCAAPRLVVGQTEPNRDPIVYNLEGDLWTWKITGTTEAGNQLTEWGHNEWLVLSPDGSRVAYSSFSSLFVDWLSTIDGAGGFLPPNNIWVADLPSSATYRIANQPEEAIWTGPNDPGTYAVRTQPSWSPDGQQLAWIEFSSDISGFADGVQTSTAHLVVYNLVSAIPSFIDSFEIQNPTSTAARLSVSWGQPGILVRASLPADILPWNYRVYDPAYGANPHLIAEIQSPDSGFVQWIKVGEEYQLINPNSLDKLIDWRTGQEETLDGVAEIYSLTAPDEAVFYQSSDTWHVRFAGQDPIDLGEDIRPFGISRDGTGVVYGHWSLNDTSNTFDYEIMVQTGGMLSQGSGFNLGRFSNPEFIWGPTGWRVTPQ